MASLAKLRACPWTPQLRRTKRSPRSTVPAVCGRRTTVAVHAWANGSSKKDPVIGSLHEVATFLAPAVAALTGDGASTGTTTTKRRQEAGTADWRSPVYALIGTFVALFFSGAVLPTTALFLSLGKGFGAWQLVTSGFVHTSLQHLAETTFMTYTFGRVLERSHGPWGLWGVYLASVIGANALALWLLPGGRAGPGLMSAASAGVLGLFTAGVLWPRWKRKPLEVAVLAPWVLVATSARYGWLGASLVVDGQPAGHLVHMAGAFLGATLASGIIWAVDAVRAWMEARRRQEKAALQQEADKEAASDALTSAARAAGNLARRML